MRPLSVPSVPDTERYIIQRTSIPSCYRITIRHGYTDDIITPSIGSTLISQLILFITRDPSTFTGLQSQVASKSASRRSPNSNSPASSVIHTPAIQAELDKINNAMNSQVVYVLGKEQMKIKKGKRSLGGWARGVVLWVFLWIRENSRGKMADLDLPMEGLVEVGFVKEI
jgi:KUP system potassium uptake protein